MRKRAKDFVRRHRPTVSLRRSEHIDPATRLVVRPIANRRSAFDLIDGTDVDYRRYTPAEDYRSAHVAVIPMHTADLAWVRERVPWIVWRLAAAGRLVLVFDRSGEGAPHRERFSDDLHALLRERRVSPHRCVLLTQNRCYRADYEAHCRRRNVDRMTVVEYDYFIARFFLDFAANGEDVLNERLAAFESRAAERERRFFALNYTARAHRVRFLLRLLGDRLLDRGFVSFGGFKGEAGASPSAIGVDDAAAMLREANDAGLLPLLPQLADRGRIVFGDASSRPEPAAADRLAADLETDLYGRSWFSVVTETEMDDQPIRITEKMLKPLVNLHPFIVFGNPGSLSRLRALGFRTFGDAIDEGYDEEPDPQARFERAYGEVRRLCSLTQEELGRLQARLCDVLVFNARHGLVKMPRIYRKTLNRELTEAIRQVVLS